MGEVQKINLSNLSDPKETLKVAFQKLRRTAFVVEDTFAFNEMNLAVSSTMTITNLNIFRSKVLKINKFMWLSVRMTLTVGGVASPFITLTVPYTFPAIGNSNTTGFPGIGNQAIAGNVSGGAADIIGLVLAVAGSNRIEVYRSDLANYTLGAVTIQFNGFFEVL